jgi:hypothetical protein
LALVSEWGFTGLPDQVARRERLVAIAMHSDEEQMEYKRQNPQPGFARPLHDAVLARAYGRLKAPDEGLKILEATTNWAEHTGSQFFDPEIYRTRAELLLLANREPEAEDSYHRALQIAREQKARMWELRAARDFACMLRRRGRLPEAHDTLAPIYGWFSEGHGTRDLQMAQVVLNTISPASGKRRHTTSPYEPSTQL